MLAYPEREEKSAGEGRMQNIQPPKGRGKKNPRGNCLIARVTRNEGTSQGGNFYLRESPSRFAKVKGKKKKKIRSRGTGDEDREPSHESVSSQKFE